jgi:hypothetical protein
MRRISGTKDRVHSKERRRERMSIRKGQLKAMEKQRDYADKGRKWPGLQLQPQFSRGLWRRRESCSHNHKVTQAALVTTDW